MLRDPQEFARDFVLTNLVKTGDDAPDQGGEGRCNGADSANYVCLGSFI
jgi:hypothetical protein